MLKPVFRYNWSSKEWEFTGYFRINTSPQIPLIGGLLDAPKKTLLKRDK